jgi:heme/copper-type cytochrome/quinol oxidase subunit 4
MDAADIFRIVIATVVVGAIGWLFWNLSTNSLK